jgi:Uncharacterized protein conserved in bacteria
LVDAGADANPALESAFDLCRSLELLPDTSESLPAPKTGATKKGRQGKADGIAPHRDLETRLLAAICDADWGDGIAGNIRRLLWVGTQVRERLSLDNWRALNSLQQQLQRYGKERPEISDALAFLDQMLLASSTLAGFRMDNMTRDDGWRS